MAIQVGMFGIEFIGRDGLPIARPDWSANTNRISMFNTLSPTELKISRSLGISQIAFAAMKRNPINNKALFAASPGAEPYPGKRQTSPFPDAGGEYHYTDPNSPRPEDDEDRKTDPVGLRVRKMRVGYPQRSGK
jgi:hypothetical protein